MNFNKHDRNRGYLSYWFEPRELHLIPLNNLTIARIDHPIASNYLPIARTDVQFKKRILN
jgi:hypothetical protein